MERRTGKEKPVNRQFCDIVREELSRCYRREKTPGAAWIYICRMLGGEVFRVPANGETKRDKILRALGRGVCSDKQIAEIYGVSKTYIWRVKKSINKNYTK